MHNYHNMHISCTGLSKKFGSKQVVKDVDLSIEPGKVLALLGPNGAGKSTTIKMLTGQLKPTSGTIIIDGDEYHSLPQENRQSLGIMPQEIVIWDDLTIRENLVYSGKLYKLAQDTLSQRVETLIKDLQLEREVNTLAKNLSGGYKRRLNLAISIIHDPEVIFLDEPSPGIDAQSRLLLTEYIEKLAKEQGHGVVLTDHYLDEAEKLADYVAIIDQGELIAEGTVAQLKAKYGQGNILQIHLDPLAKDSTLSDKDKLLKMFSKDFKNPNLIKETINILVQDPSGSLNKALKIIEQNSLSILNINLKEPSLEDIFLLITGRGVRE